MTTKQAPLTGSDQIRVLVVDDDRTAAHLMSTLLESLGPFDVETVYDGPSALERADEFQPQVFVIDILMEEMDGLAVARRLRADERFERSLLVAFTALDRPVDRRRIQVAGFDEHLLKPLNIEELRTILDRHLDRTGPRPERPPH